MIADNESIFENFHTWFRAGHSPASASSYKYALYPFRKWLENRNHEHAKPCLIISLTFECLLEYIENLQQAPLKPNTRAIYVTALKGLYKWLKMQGKSPFDPDLIPTIPIDQGASSRNAATEEEVQAILGTFDEYFPDDLRNKAAISLLWDSGIRLGELLSLDIDSIDTVAMQGRVKTYKRKNHYRTIRWWHHTNELLKRWLVIRDTVLERMGYQQNALFITLSPNSYYERLGRHVIQGAMRESCKRVGITRQITPHTLRHGNLTILLRDGMNIREVQVHAGHAKVTTTQIYTHVEDSEVDSKYRRIQEQRYNSVSYGHQSSGQEKERLRSDGTKGRTGNGQYPSKITLPRVIAKNERETRQRKGTRKG